jgi:nicotinamidase-related amidase
MSDCLLLIDLFNDFQHDDGDVLLACFRDRFPAVRELIRVAREHGTPILYANDSFGNFDGDGRGVIERAQEGPAGHLLETIAPRRKDRFIVKPRYSAFDHTPLALVLEDLGIERILLAGMSTEGCVAQTAIDARENGFKVTVIASACCTVDLELEEVALAYLERVVGVKVGIALDEPTAGDEHVASISAETCGTSPG